MRVRWGVYGGGINVTVPQCHISISRSVVVIGLSSLLQTQGHVRVTQSQVNVFQGHPSSTRSLISLSETLGHVGVAEGQVKVMAGNGSVGQTRRCVDEVVSEVDGCPQTSSSSDVDVLRAAAQLTLLMSSDTLNYIITS